MNTLYDPQTHPDINLPKTKKCFVCSRLLIIIALHVCTMYILYNMFSSFEDEFNTCASISTCNITCALSHFCFIIYALHVCTLYTIVFFLVITGNHLCQHIYLLAKSRVHFIFHISAWNWLQFLLYLFLNLCP